MDQWFEAAGAAAWGAVSFGGLAPYMDRDALSRASQLCPHPAGVLVAAFPYYAGEGEGNLSLYARGEDYHLAVSRRLESVCRALRGAYPGRSFVPGVDASPLPEREAAALAGLGLQGLHSLVILPPWGSYVFLGTILTDLPLEAPPSPAPDCIRCGRCAAACPGGAIGPGGVDPERCLSHLTQKKGELTPGQQALLGAHPLAWGCDTCQQVCPYNQGPALTPLPEFRQGLIGSLEPSDLEGLTNRGFREKYPGRAFTWRGPAVLRRNLALHKSAAFRGN